MSDISEIFIDFLVMQIIRDPKTSQREALKY